MTISSERAPAGQANYPPLPFVGSPPPREGWVLDQGFGFDPERWKRQLSAPELWPHELEFCPIRGRWPRVDRATVLGIGDRAVEPLGALQTFVAAAAWGTGTKAQGVQRRLRVLGPGRAEVGEQLAAAVRTMHTAGAAAAYDVLHGDRNAVKDLGPSFGTKVLYFAGFDRTPGPQPLILDKYVAIAINRLCGYQWPWNGWTTGQYATYLELADSWAAAWAVRPDVIERVLFSVGKASGLVVGVLAGTRLDT